MAAKTMPVGSLIVGVDLDAIRPIPGVTTMVGDITSQKTRQVRQRVAHHRRKSVCHAFTPPAAAGHCRQSNIQGCHKIMSRVRDARQLPRCNYGRSAPAPVACTQDLKKALGGAMADTVIHDGAPNVGGVWASEAYSQSALVLDALRLATEFLGPRGTFVTKIFR